MTAKHHKNKQIFMTQHHEEPNSRSGGRPWPIPQHNWSEWRGCHILSRWIIVVPWMVTPVSCSILLVPFAVECPGAAGFAYFVRSKGTEERWWVEYEINEVVIITIIITITPLFRSFYRGKALYALYADSHVSCMSNVLYGFGFFSFVNGLRPKNTLWTIVNTYQAVLPHILLSRCCFLYP